MVLVAETTPRNEEESKLQRFKEIACEREKEEEKERNRRRDREIEKEREKKRKGTLNYN